MKRIHIILLGLAFSLAGLTERGLAQVPIPIVSVGFRNDTPTAIIVQGTSKVNNVPRRGQPFSVAPGKINYDNNVPFGIPRFISIYDAAQPSKILLSNKQVLIQHREPVFLVVRNTLPGQGQVMLIPVPPSVSSPPSPPSPPPPPPPPPDPPPDSDP